MDMFCQINECDGVSVVLVTHEPEIAEKAKRVVRLIDGEITDDRII